MFFPYSFGEPGRYTQMNVQQSPRRFFLDIGWARHYRR